ncbi:hypothetical protein G9A89_008730 [Geosiphon pyriformis]|nr:hypothetical protein G9A89_008730 [Geosiphon pyriformis]
MEKSSITSTKLSKSNNRKEILNKLKSLHILRGIKRIKNYHGNKILERPTSKDLGHRPLQLLQMKQQQQQQQEEEEEEEEENNQSLQCESVNKVIDVLEPAVIRQSFILVESDSSKIIDISEMIKNDEEDEICDDEVPSITMVDIIKMIKTEYHSKEFIKELKV